jgi:hypothetical protein
LLDKTVFVDLLPRHEPDADRLEDALLIATHVIYVLRKDEQGLALHGFDHGKLDALAMKEKLVVASPRNERIVFIADSKRLQEFFRDHGSSLQQKEPLVVLKRKS